MAVPSIQEWTDAAWERQVWLRLRHQAGADRLPGDDAYNLIREFPVPENQEGENAADSELPRGSRVFINIQFGNFVPALSFWSGSSTGAIIRQGPHHSAHASTRTGIADDAATTSSAKLASVTICGFVTRKSTRS